MTVSHLNDSYFWVVSQFSNMNTNTALRCHTVITLFQGNQIDQVNNLQEERQPYSLLAAERLQINDNSNTDS